MLLCPHPPSREAKKWALMSEHKAANNSVEAKVVGNACHECWSVWQTAYASEFGEFRSFCDAYHGDEGRAKAIDKSFSVARKTEAADFSKEEVVEQASVGLSVDRHFLALSEAELRSMLRVPRLLKAHTRSLPTALVPAENGGSQEERLFFFQDPERPFRTARLTSTTSCRTAGLAMDRDTSLYKEQGRHVMSQTWGRNEVALASLPSARVQGIDEFLASQGVSRSGGAHSHGQGHAALAARANEDEDDIVEDMSGDEQSDAEADDGTAGNKVRLVGVAASMATSMPTGSLATTRPPVPAFSSGKKRVTAASRRRQPVEAHDAASATSRPSAASFDASGSGGGGGDDGGDDSGDSGSSDFEEDDAGDSEGPQVTIRSCLSGACASDSMAPKSTI